MEIKKIVEELRLVNDVNLLSLEELEEKYLGNEEEYKDFFQNYVGFFNNHPTYQLRIADKYEKINELLKRGNAKYDNNENEDMYKTMLKWMNITLSQFRVSENQQCEDQIQSEYVLYDMLGLNSLKNRPSYNDMVSGVYEAVKKYAEKDGSISDFQAYLSSKVNIIKSREDAIKIVEDYISTHSLTNECNDINFLLFVKYMVVMYGKEIDEELLSDCKDVVAASQVLQTMGYECDGYYTDQEYNKVASKTLKRIKEYEKDKEQEESKGRRKIRQLFTHYGNK